MFCDNLEVKCRTCLGMVDQNTSTHLKRKLKLGQTIEEILLLFLPQMVKSKFVGDYICNDCIDTVQIFVQFIQRCKTVEKYLREQDLKQKLNEALKEKSITGQKIKNIKHGPTVNKDNSLQGGRKLNPLCKKVIKQELKEPPEELTNFIKPLRTYSRKKPLLIPKEEPLQIPDQLPPDTIACVEANTLPSITIYTKNVDGQIERVFSEYTIHCSSSENQQNASTTDFIDDCGENVTYNLCSNNSTYSNNTTLSKPISCTSIKDECEDKNDSVEADSLETSTEDYSNFCEKNSLTTIKSEKIYSSDDNNSNNEIQAEDTLDTILNNTDIIETYDSSLSLHQNIPHDRLITFSETDTKIADILQKFSESEIKLFKLETLQETGRKRILLFGRAYTNCPKCKTLFGSMKEMRRHFFKLHPHSNFRRVRNNCEVIISNSTNSDSFKKCPECGKLFNTTMALDRHFYKEHKDYRRFKCDKCGSGFRNKGTYFSHLRNYRLYETCSVRSCTICKKMIPRDDYKTHFDVHRIYECSMCNRRFSNQKFLNQHILNHGKKPKQKELCNICGKFCSDAGNLRVHLLTHTEKRDFLCDKCTKAFKSQSSLNKHSKMVHNDTRDFECNICKKRTKDKTGLQFHMRLKHSNDYSFVCSICGKGFMRQDYYKRHMNRLCRGNQCNVKKTGTGPPVTCKFCHKKYGNISRLRMHLLGSHLKMKLRSKCRYCNMTFAGMSNKLRHEKRHKNPKLFELSCIVCFNRFGTKEELEAHSVKHKDSKKRKCEECGEAFPSKFLLGHHIGKMHFNENILNEEQKNLLQEGLGDLLRK